MTDWMTPYVLNMGYDLRTKACSGPWAWRRCVLLSLAAATKAMPALAWPKALQVMKELRSQAKGFKDLIM